MATILLSLAGIYLLAGLIFAVIFVFFLVQNFDEHAKNGKLGFRLLIIPGSILFWPYLLRQYFKKIKS